MANSGNKSCSRILAVLESEPAPRIRARLAMAMLYLGDPRGASACLELAPDPIYRTTFVDEFATYDHWPRDLSDILTTTKDTSLRSGLCEALGTVAVGRFSEQEFEQLKGTLLQLIETATDGATHSAATWTLRQWKVPVSDSHRSRDPAPGCNWFVNLHGVTMIRIPAGTFTMGRQVPSYDESPPPPPANTIPHEVTLTSDFWISACEVTHGLYRQFLKDETLEGSERPPGDQPDAPLRSSHESHAVNCVSWFDALLFCNWLSRREGRSPCYRRTGAVQSADHVQETWDVWDCDFGSDGYRLLTEAEWEYACKAGSETAFSFGGLTEHVSDFAVFRASGLDYIETKRPNGWGLFDMHGNLSEWCWDPQLGSSLEPATDPHGKVISRYRPIRGGTWFFRDPVQLRSAERLVSDRLSYRDANIGFRIALTGPQTRNSSNGPNARPAAPTDSAHANDPQHSPDLPAPFILGWNEEYRFEKDDVHTSEWLTVFGTAPPGVVVELLDAMAGTTFTQGVVSPEGTWRLRVVDDGDRPEHLVARTRNYANRASRLSKILSFDADRKGSLHTFGPFITRPVIEGWRAEIGEAIEVVMTGTASQTLA